MYRKGQKIDFWVEGYAKVFSGILVKACQTDFVYRVKLDENSKTELGLNYLSIDYGQIIPKK